MTIQSIESIRAAAVADAQAAYRRGDEKLRTYSLDEEVQAIYNDSFYGELMSLNGEATA